MDRPASFFGPESIAGALLVLSLTAAAGLAIGRVRFGGLRFGIAGVLFAGQGFGHFQFQPHPKVLEFAREFGLILFVYTIGMQTGPGFFQSLRKQGLPLNLLAAGIVLAGAGITLLLVRWAGLDLPLAVGLFSGATTNTPSLGAAQEALGSISGMTPERLELPALGYAAAYPFGIMGIIFSMVVLRKMFNVDVEREKADCPSPAPRTPLTPEPDRLRLIPMFVGIALGILVGLFPVFIPGLPAPLRLGLAGGPLVTAIALARVGRIGPLVWHLPAGANAALRELGIVLFLACVGLKAGGRFFHTLFQGDGLFWMLCGAVITVAPLLAAGCAARLVLKMNYLHLCGLLSGSMTDPPALAFANAAARSDLPSAAYSTVYPLTMLLRILAAQLIVLYFAR